MQKEEAKLPFRTLGLFECYVLVIALSKLGNQIYYFTIPLYIYDKTNSLSAMGFGWLVQTLPYIFTPWIGKIIDIFDRRKLFITTELIQATFVAIIPLVASLFGDVSIYLLYIITICVQSAGVASNIVGDYSFTSEFMRTEDKSIWNSWYLTMTNIGRIAGYGASGILLSTLGSLSVLLIDSFSFLITAAFTFFAVKGLRRNAEKTPVRLREGFSFLRKNTQFFRIIIAFAITNLALGGLVVLLMYYLQSRWAMSKTSIGFVLSSASFFGIIGTIFGGKLFTKLNLVKRLQMWTLLQAVCLAPFIFLLKIPVILGYLLSEACSNAANVLFMTYRQQEIPPELMGRVNALIRTMLLSAAAVSSVILTSLEELSTKSLTGIFIVLQLLIGTCLLYSRRQTQIERDNEFKGEI